LKNPAQNAPPQFRGQKNGNFPCATVMSTALNDFLALYNNWCITAHVEPPFTYLLPI
tara:strand:+ start:988 stop:1158 length:171 start_codon:yes stop_codon:yes gene_type:complete